MNEAIHNEKKDKVPLFSGKILTRRAVFWKKFVPSLAAIDELFYPGKFKLALHNSSLALRPSGAPNYGGCFK